MIKGILALARWREYIGFVTPLTLLGSLLAIRESGGQLDLRIVTVLFGNLFAVAYAFMLNDIEDAGDDSRDPQKAKRNPVSNNQISKRAAYNACIAVATLTLFLYALSGLWVLWIGIGTLLLSHFYSWKPVRLKAWPVVDIVSHSLMLSALLILAGYYTYETTPGVVWFVVAAVTLFSVYGQLYNQLRDLEVDKKARLKNTAILLGEEKAQVLMYLSLGLGISCLLISIFKGVFPIWIGGVGVLALVATSKFHAKTDASGTAALDLTGTMQLKVHIVTSAIVISWLIVQLSSQYF